jgi:hypothetical protein
VDTATDVNTANAAPFTWPDPGEDFWQAAGAQLGLDTDTIKFAAALHALGGAGSRKNTQAARIAGLDLDRVKSFRLARSVGVSKILEEADKLKRGKRPPLSEAELDRRIDEGCRSRDPITCARFIELREKRKAVARAKHEGRDDHLNDERICRHFLEKENGASAFMLWWSARMGSTGHAANLPLMHDVAFYAAKEPFGPAIWNYICRNLSDNMKECLRERLANPEHGLEWRLAAWREIDREPPAGQNGAIDPREVANAA